MALQLGSSGHDGEHPLLSAVSECSRKAALERVYVRKADTSARWIHPHSSTCHEYSQWIVFPWQPHRRRCFPGLLRRLQKSLAKQSN